MSKDRVNQIVERNGLLGVIENNQTLRIKYSGKKGYEAVKAALDDCDVPRPGMDNKANEG